LEQKLKPHEETPGELTEALDFLAAKDFINEKRVVESVVNRRSTKLGAARVRQELMAKGLPADDIAEAVRTMRGTEFERALVVWRKKFGAPPSDASERAKQVRFLVSRGFAPDVVRRIVAGADEL
jgi:regulatory protein